MATPPDFTTGQVLTAAQMNAVGLWFIKSATLTGSTVDVVSCFTDDFEAYELVFTNVKLNTTAQVVTYQLLDGTSPANGANYNVQRGSLQGTTWNNTSANSTTAGYALTVGTDIAHGATLKIWNPQLAQRTMSLSQSIYSGNSALPYIELLSTTHNLATSYDGIRLLPISTFASGTVRVYGYRE